MEREALKRRHRLKKRMITAGVIGLILGLTVVFSILYYKNKEQETMKTWAGEPPFHKLGSCRKRKIIPQLTT